MHVILSYESCEWVSFNSRIRYYKQDEDILICRHTMSSNMSFIHTFEKLNNKLNILTLLSQRMFK